jgi:hypothetical protein
MSRVAELSQARDSLSVKFKEFTRIISKNKVPMFFEGEDEKYFSVRINNICSNLSWTGINSGGKKKVIALREKVRKHPFYKNSICLFFIDSDFDDNTQYLSFDDTYITPCYSVENLYITTSAFQRVLNAEFGINDVCENSTCFESCTTIYEKAKKDYLDKISAFNFMIREIRIMEKCNDIKNTLNLNNINFDSLIKIQLHDIEKVYDENSPNSIFTDLESGITINLKSSEEYFSSQNRELWFRGKQHLEFMRIFLTQLKADRNIKAGRKVFKEKGNVKLQLTKGNTISELSQYADTPQCLRDFLLRQNFN